MQSRCGGGWSRGSEEYPPTLCIHPPTPLPEPIGECGAWKMASKGTLDVENHLVLFLISEKKRFGPYLQFCKLQGPFILC